MIVTPLAATGVVAICLLTEGFFSGSEIAVVSASRPRLKEAAEQGSRGASLALSMLERPEYLLGTCLIGTNLSTVTASTAATAALVAAYGDVGSAIAVALLFPCILLAGELVPKSVYQHYADRLAPWVIFPLRGASLVFTPILAGMEGVTRLMFRMLGTQGEVSRTATREDIQMLLEAAEGVDIEEDELEMVQRVLEFSQARVHEVMKPLIEVKSLPETASARHAIERMVETGHSRLPLFRDRVDRVIGIVHHSDLLHVEDLETPVSELAQPACFVPESKRVEELFVELREEGIRVAIPVDEYGGAVGLITMEDILEEIVGEIADEHDQANAPVRKVGERTWLASARVEAEVLESVTGFDLPEGDYETLAGFLLERLGCIPDVGAKVLEQGFVLEVTKASDRAILQVSVRQVVD